MSGKATPVRQNPGANPYSEAEIGLSVVTVVHLTHGVYRARLEERRQRRQAFVDELTRVPEHPETVGKRIAPRVGKAQTESP